MIPELPGAPGYAVVYHRFDTETQQRVGSIAPYADAWQKARQWVWDWRHYRIDGGRNGAFPKDRYHWHLFKHNRFYGVLALIPE